MRRRRFVALMRHEVGVARAIAYRRAPSCIGLVDRRLGRDMLMFAGGGLAILRAIERVGYDVFSRRPKLDEAGLSEAEDGTRCAGGWMPELEWRRSGGNRQIA